MDLKDVLNPTEPEAVPALGTNPDTIAVIANADTPQHDTQPGTRSRILNLK